MEKKPKKTKVSAKTSKPTNGAVVGVEAKIYTRKGVAAGSVKLPTQFFGLGLNNDMVHQVLESMRSNARTGNAHTKDRSEVRGGGKKPWRQKGTGRARHGSSRSPIWIGGGTTHGPRTEKDYSKKINRKMKSKALFTILSTKLRDGEVLFTEPLIFAKPEAKLAVKDISALAKVAGFEKLLYQNGKRALIVTPHKDDAMLKSFANIKTVAIEEARNINPLSVATYQYLIMTDPEKILEQLTLRA